MRTIDLNHYDYFFYSPYKRGSRFLFRPKKPEKYYWEYYDDFKIQIKEEDLLEDMKTISKLIDMPLFVTKEKHPKYIFSKHPREKVKHDIFMVKGLMPPREKL